MKRNAMYWITTTIIAGFLVSACSVSFSTGTAHTVKGQDDIRVSAVQPAKPEPPPPPPPPKKVKVTEKAIEITEKIMFDVDKATIQPVSYDLLNDIADVMKQYDNLKKIQIEGHTDGDGSAAYNKTLSDNRAKSVLDYLVKAGVEADRLVAKGFGKERPIADNDTTEGKEKNRRVEFNILKQTPRVKEVEVE